MPEAYIYDHVRTPRGKGKSDGSLHEVTALALATVPLKALKERNNLAADSVDDVGAGALSIRSAKPAATSRALPAMNAGFSDIGAGRPDQPLLRLRSRCGELRRGAGDGGPA